MRRLPTEVIAQASMQGSDNGVMSWRRIKRSIAAAGSPTRWSMSPYLCGARRALRENVIRYPAPPGRRGPDAKRKIKTMGKLKQSVP